MLNTAVAILISVLGGLAGLALLVFILKEIIKKEIRSEFEFSRAELESKAASELEARKTAVETSVKDLKDQLEKYSQLVQRFKEESFQKYGNIETELKNASQATTKLQETTSHLTNVLGNVKKRGEWGERMAEDIIALCGLQEGVNYKKQKKMDSTSTKPDYTFLLPDKHKVNMDVKFPLNNYLNMVNATDAMQREAFKKEFINDARKRIREVQGRDYVNPGEGTLDFVLIFIPNEQVYGFIQENDASLMDEALSKKVVLCSPFTLYAMLSIIRKAFENFHYEKATKQIVEMIDLFAQNYRKFKERFQDLGIKMQKTVEEYADIRDKSFKRLDSNVKKIEDYKKGNISVSSKDVIDISAETEPEQIEEA